MEFEEGLGSGVRGLSSLLEDFLLCNACNALQLP